MNYIKIFVMKRINQTTINLGRLLLILTLSLFLNNPCQSICQIQESDPYNIKVDKRVELISTVCRLAGYDEYNMGSYPAYYKIVGDYFEAFKNHKAVKIARKIRSTNSIGYNAPMGLAIYLKDINTMETKVPFTEIPDEMDDRWDIEAATEFISALKDFVKDTNFESFFRSNKKLYDVAVGRFRNLMEKDEIEKWFNEYFGVKQGNQFRLILGLQNGGANYAARATSSDGGKQIYSIIGCWMQDEDGYPDFPKSIISTVVHEFCHSYTNPIVDSHLDILKKSAELLFPLVEEKMTSMAYPSWQIMMYETFVRVCVIRYMKDNYGNEKANREAAHDVERGFLWVDDLAKFLYQYESNRDKYPTFDQFVPRIADNLYTHVEVVRNQISQEPDDNKEKWEKSKMEGPKIVKIFPENGAKNVDPEIKEIRLTFNRKMGKGMSVMKVFFENYPEITGNAGFDDSGTVFTIPVKLKSDWNYHMEFNHFQSDHFRDKAGIPLYPYVYKFETGSRR